jgi:maltose alpha-D-glucosyltransferase / alpha-amylase
VTDEERDYMVERYAADRQTRINLGIRRRLAPLLENDRRRIELMNLLLLSLPGTPVLYYGDEIGMGDNAYLGDRDGVRTPMQWSPDRNGGFSRANPQRLILPTIIDPEYSYETVNVEVQGSNPSSLLWWMKRMIALRRSHTAFGRGSLQMLAPENRKVLAFLRRYGSETLLVVANLSRYAQWVELELGEFAGTTPVELVGNGAFPPIEARPYRLTLGGHDALWLSLSSSLERQRRTSLAPPQLSPTIYAGPLLGLLSPGSALEPMLAVHIPAQRWFRSKTRSVSKARLVDTLTLPHKQPEHDAVSSLSLAFVHLEYVEGDPETYVLPLCVVSAAEAPDGALMGLRQEGEAAPRRWICDASRLPETAAALQAIAFGEQRVPGRALSLRGVKSGSSEPSSEPIKPLGAEQSNTSFLFGQQLVGKLLRKVEAGGSLEVETLEALRISGRRANVPTLEARIDIESSAENATLWMSERFVPNEGDAWQLAVDHAQRFYETVLTQRQGELPPLMQRGQFEVEVPAAPEPDFLPLARLLGKRTAELHGALFGSFGGPLAPRPFTALSSRAFYQSVRNLSARAFDALKGAPLTERSMRLAHSVLERRATFRKLIDRALVKPLAGQRMRVHGDYHLGQVLYTGSDFHIIDFEGEPARSLAERRRLRSPLADVAGMMRSLHYAAFGVLTMQLPGTQIRPEDREQLEPWARYFAERCARAFFTSYCKAGEAAGFLPENPEELQVLLEIHLVEKALYELLYELNNRPSWAELPLRGLLDIAEG